MKKMSVGVLVASLAMSGAAIAGDGPEGPENHGGKAPEGYYISLGAGVVGLQELENAGSELDFNTGFSLHGAVGYDTGDQFELGKARFDVEVFYTENDTENLTIGAASTNVAGDLSTNGVLANAYFDFLPGAVVRPYIGVGLGFAEASLNATAAGFTTTGESSNEFAYRLAAGGTYQITDSLALDLGYRFLNINTNTEIGAHSVVTSLRYGF